MSYLPKIVEKPWGREIWWAETAAYLGKILEVRAGHELSLQYHREKLETLFFYRGEGVLSLAGRRMPLQSGSAVTIQPGVVHRLAATTDLIVFEVSTAHPDDVVRLEDTYGRREDG
jgi:mannose-6-phosphate isomerase-like protein (cupin superfamily)